MARNQIIPWVLSMAGAIGAAAPTDAKSAESACPKSGPSAYCCQLQDPPFSEDPANYRWHPESGMCEGLISARIGAPDLNLVGLVTEPIPTIAQFQELKQPIQISIPKLPFELTNPIRVNGTSLTGGRYFLAADLSDGNPRSWDVKQFREKASLRNFDFVAFHPADQKSGRDVVYVPVRLVLPGAGVPVLKAARIRLLAGMPFEKARATYLPLDAALRPDTTKQEVELPSQAASPRQLVVRVPEGAPTALRLLIRLCSAGLDTCDLERTSPAIFDLVMSE